MTRIPAMLLVLLMHAVAASACTYIPTVLSPNFNVHVTSADSDAGVHVLLAGKQRYEMTTDGHGRARFEHVAFGRYVVVAGASIQPVVVGEPASSQDGTVELPYRESRVLRVKSLSGTFINMPDAKVRLTALAADDQPLGSVIVGGTKDFDLGMFANAISTVMLEIENEGTWWPNFKFGVHLDAAARFQRLTLAYYPGACGTSGIELAMPCSDAPLVIHSRCGQAVDPSGAVISKATVKVKDATGQRVLYSTRADDMGDFALPVLAPGEYVVQLTSPGFVESSAVVAVHPTTMKLDGCEDMVRMTMTVGGCVNPQVVDISKKLEAR